MERVRARFIWHGCFIKKRRKSLIEKGWETDGAYDNGEGGNGGNGD